MKRSEYNNSILTLDKKNEELAAIVENLQRLHIEKEEMKEKCEGDYNNYFHQFRN